MCGMILQRCYPLNVMNVTHLDVFRYRRILYTHGQDTPTTRHVHNTTFFVYTLYSRDSHLRLAYRAICNWNFEQFLCEGPRVGNSLIAHSLKSLRTNERMWAIRSSSSGQMSDCERIAQVAHDKWANVSVSLWSLRTNERIAWFFLSKSLISLSLTINEQFPQKNSKDCILCTFLTFF